MSLKKSHLEDLALSSGPADSVLEQQIPGVCCGKAGNPQNPHSTLLTKERSFVVGRNRYSAIEVHVEEVGCRSSSVADKITNKPLKVKLGLFSYDSLITVFSPALQECSHQYQRAAGTGHSIFT